jgi:hypothetical protein
MSLGVYYNHYYSKAGDCVLKINKHSQLIFLKLVVILLLTTPSFGMLYSLTGYHLSNEKFALIISLISLIYLKEKVEKRLSLLSIIGIFLIVLISTSRSALFQTKLFLDQDISIILWLIAFPLYFTLFSYKSSINKKVFFYSLVFHISTFALQMILGWTTTLSIESFFISNPFQIGYSYPEVYPGFFRYAGFFNESSQLAIYICAMYWLFKEEKWSVFLIIPTLLTFSMTGYLLFLFLYFGHGRKRLKLKYLFLLSFSVITLSYKFILAIISAITVRINLIFSGVVQEPRILYLQQNLERFLENFFLGIGASSSDMNRWDILSVYFLPFGIVGGLYWLFFLFYLNKRLNINSLSIFIIFLTNATVLSFANTVLLLSGSESKNK